MTADFVFVSNDKYVKYLGICTYSVMHNMCPVVEKVRLFVMDCGITEESKAKLRQQTAKFHNAVIVFIDIRKKLDEVVPKVETKWNRAIYGRLFLTEIYKQFDDVDRLIYLDCDVLIDRPVTELFTMPLDGKCMAGVLDIDWFWRKKQMKMDPDAFYVNSGVLVVDTARWRELDASARIIEFINNYPDELSYPDQDAINYVLSSEIKVLDLRYNMMNMLTYSDAKKIGIYAVDYPFTEAQTIRALYNASIYHYSGHDMWSYDGITPAQRIIFKKYRKLCDWRKEKMTFGGRDRFIHWLMVLAKRILICEWPRTYYFMAKKNWGE